MYNPYLHQLLNRLLDEFQTQETSPSFRDFATRLSANLAKMYQCMQWLYGGRKDMDEQFESLIRGLFEMFQERSETLRKVDKEREQNPDWLLSEQIVGMSLYTDRFAKDLTDFQSKTPYLEELGVNFVHLMPLLDAPEGSNDGGYAVSDYRKVNPKLGTMEDIQNITQSFRDKGMFLMLDMVMNHTSDQHEWAQKALAGDPKYLNYFYTYEDRFIPDQFEESLPEVFPESAAGNFTYIGELKRWVMTVFHNYQWDLNYTNPEVFTEMTKNLLFLANQGVDVLRMDAVAFTWKKTGTDSQNLWEAHIILQFMKSCCQVVAPSVALLAEAIVPPLEIIKYFGEGSAAGYECDVAYNATFMALLWEAIATQNTKLLEKGMHNIPQKPYGTTWINYLRCHDDIGLGFENDHIYELGYNAPEHRKFLVDYYSGKLDWTPAKGATFMFNPKTGDARISGSLAGLAGLEKALQDQDSQAVDLAIRKIVMLHSIVLSYGGLPMLYYGDELGELNFYDYLQEPDKSYDNRWMHRPMFNWDKAEKRNHDGTPEQQIFSELQKLIQIRRQSPEFADHNNCNLEHSENEHIFTYLRWDTEGRKTLVMCNFENRIHFAQDAILARCGFHNRSKVIDKYSGKAPKFYESNIEFEPYQFYWLVEK